MTALDLWRQWYAMEDSRPVGTVGDPAYDAWTAQCAAIYTAAKAMTTRCRSYYRGRGVFTYSGIRCEREHGHTGRHIAPGRWLDPTRMHHWGR